MTASGPPEGAPRRPADDVDDAPVLPDVSRDETDVGWGDDSGARSDDWYHRERPPHHE